MRRLIGLHGRAHAGKDTVADYLVQQHYYTKYAFADPIRDMGRGIFGFSDEEMTNPDLKETKNLYWGRSWREFAQLLGTEAVRNTLGQDTWLKVASLRLRYPLANRLPLVISDVRFNNEATWIKYHDGIIVHISRPNPRPLTHSSEEGINQALIDYHLTNNQSLQALYNAIEVIVRGP